MGNSRQTAAKKHSNSESAAFENDKSRLRTGIGMGEYVGATVLTSTSCGLAPGLRGAPTASHERVQFGHNYRIGALETSTSLLSFEEIESINIMNEAEG